MVVSKQLIREAVKSLADVEGYYMDEAALVEDCVLLAMSFPDERDFMAACSSTRQMLQFIAENRARSGRLKCEYAGWRSCYYQHRAGRSVQETCSITYCRFGSMVLVKGFGFRQVPANYYVYLGEIRKQRALGASNSVRPLRCG